MTRRAPLPPPFMPGDRVTIDVQGRMTNGVVWSVDRDPRTDEWTYVMVTDPQGNGAYRRHHAEIARGWNA